MAKVNFTTRRPASTAKMQELWDALIDMRRRPNWRFFEQMLPKLLYGSPEEVKALCNGDLSAFDNGMAPVREA